MTAQTNPQPKETPEEEKRRLHEEMEFLSVRKSMIKANPRCHTCNGTGAPFITTYRDKDKVMRSALMICHCAEYGDTEYTRLKKSIDELRIAMERESELNKQRTEIMVIAAGVIETRTFFGGILHAYRSIRRAFPKVYHRLKGDGGRKNQKEGGERRSPDPDREDSMQAMPQVAPPSKGE